MKVIVALILFLLQITAQAQTNTQCLQYALWKEARGEKILTQRAVLDVIHERMRITGKSACRVLKMPFQFPYMAGGVKPVDKKFKLRYNFVVGMEKVLPKGYVYFNDTPHKFGRKTKKIGNIYFAK